MNQPLQATEAELALVEEVAQFSQDPEGYVLYAFPWGEGELKERSPEEWQLAVLRDLGAGLITIDQALRIAVASGHGIGKSALVAWVILWAMSTCEDTKGVVTANTETQLRTKTWAELSKWHRLCINRHWFKVTATAIFSADEAHEKTWRIDAVPWSERNTEAFAGLHNQGKRIVLIFDEGSAIPDVIWEVAEGALTDEDTEILWATFGNPTRNTGRFRECFGRFRHRWNTRQVDSRSVRISNKRQIAEWVDDYGEDSDFVRVRVRGMFPRASSLQFIETDAVAEARRRKVHWSDNDPLIMGIDIARGGDDMCVIRFRRGGDSRSIPPTRIPGSEVRNSSKLVAKICQLIELHQPDGIFGDSTGVGGPVLDRLRQLGHPVQDVCFSWGSPDSHYANFRTYIWARMRDWLRTVGCIEDDPQLEQDLTGPEYSHNKKDQLILESKDDMKSRGLASPDDGDALAVTFAFPVAKRMPFARPHKAITDYDPIAPQGQPGRAAMDYEPA